MKKRLTIFCVLLAGLLSSCTAMKEDHPSKYDYSYWTDLGVEPGKTYTAIASAVWVYEGPDYDDGYFYLKVNDKLRIVDAGKEITTKTKRVYCQFRLLDVKPDPRFCYADIDWYEYIEMGLDDRPVGTLYDFYHPQSGRDPATRRDDGLDVIEDWMTTFEDGYFTLHYSAWWGKGDAHHVIYLSRDNENDPLEFTIVNDTLNDEKLEKNDALIYIDMNYLSSYIDENQTITFKWKTCAGATAEKQFPFKGRTE